MCLNFKVTRQSVQQKNVACPENNTSAVKAWGRINGILSKQQKCP